MLSKQEIYNKVRAHLLKQGKRSFYTCGDSQICAYRSPDDLKCAVGCLILDQYYTNSSEGFVCTSSNVVTALSASGVDMGEDGTRSLLLQLQSLHDYRDCTAWESALDDIAEEFGLDIPKDEV